MVNIAVFASGSGTNFENIVKANLSHVNVKLLIVDKESAYAIERANHLGVPYVYVNPKAFPSKKEYEMKIMEYLHEYEIELIVLAGYMRFIGEVLLSNYPRKIINIHPAYLPAFPGAHGIADAYNYGVKVFGVTIHYVDSGVDSGKIIAQEAFNYTEGDSLEEVEKKIHAIEHKLYPKTIKKLLEVENEKSTC